MNPAIDKAAEQARTFRNAANMMDDLMHDAMRVLRATKAANANSESIAAAAVAHALAAQAREAANAASFAAQHLCGELMKDKP